MSGYEGKIVLIHPDSRRCGRRSRAHPAVAAAESRGATGARAQSATAFARSMPPAALPTSRRKLLLRARALGWPSRPRQIFLWERSTWRALLPAPTTNQIVNASKFQLGELYTQEKLDRALENVRQLMQEGGYYRARVTAESTSNAATQQVDILFHITRGEPAHVGEVKVTGTSDLSSGEVQSIAHHEPGDRLTAARVSGSLQRLRKRFQKQNRALAQVSIADQPYHAENQCRGFHLPDRSRPGGGDLRPGFPQSAAAS